MNKTVTSQGLLDSDMQLKKGMDSPLSNVVIKCTIVISYLCQMLVLFNREMFELYTGPVLAVCFLILTYTQYYYIPFALVLVTPNALGTVFMGRISFFVFSLFLLILRVIIIKGAVKFVLSDVFWFVLGVANAFNLKITASDNVGWHKIILTCILTIWLIYINVDDRKKEGVIDGFLISFAVAITTNAIVTLITGTATKYATSDRMGIVGFGSNDPNIAAMALSLAIAIIISSQSFKLLPKMAMAICLFIAVVTTVSISGLIACILTLLLFVIITSKNRQNISVFCFIIFGALLAVYMFPMLGIVGAEKASGEAVNYLEYYQQKISNKLFSVSNSDIDSATSGRAELIRMNMEYLFEQSAIRQFFGGNNVNPLGVNVSHNTFIDITLRFGYIGLICVIIMMVYSTIKCIHRTRKTGNCNRLLCKFLMIYWSMTLSLFDGSGAVLWLGFVLLL